MKMKKKSILRCVRGTFYGEGARGCRGGEKNVTTKNLGRLRWQMAYNIKGADGRHLCAV
jgi:hypothetical protein